MPFRSRKHRLMGPLVARKAFDYNGKSFAPGDPFPTENEGSYRLGLLLRNGKLKPAPEGETPDPVEIVEPTAPESESTLASWHDVKTHKAIDALAAVVFANWGLPDGWDYLTIATKREALDAATLLD